MRAQPVIMAWDCGGLVDRVAGGERVVAGGVRRMVITEVDSMAILYQAFEAAQTYSSRSKADINGILKKTETAAADRKYEPFKTTPVFDSTASHPEWLGYGRNRKHWPSFSSLCHRQTTEGGERAETTANPMVPSPGRGYRNYLWNLQCGWDTPCRRGTAILLRKR